MMAIIPVQLVIQNSQGWLKIGLAGCLGSSSVNL